MSCIWKVLSRSRANPELTGWTSTSQVLEGNRLGREIACEKIARQVLQCAGLDDRPMSDACCPGELAGDDGDSGIGDNLGLECRRVCHIHIELQMKIPGDKLPERAAVAIFHPAVGANETEMTARGQEAQGALKK
jgi:hypothetical protein